MTNKIVIHGNDSVIRRASAEKVRILLIDGPHGELHLDHIAIRDGHTSDSGGGISIRPHAKLVAHDVTLTGNAADVRGGAIDNFAGTVALRNSTIDGNTSLRGGGIFLDGTTQLHDTTLSGNTATASGGAAFVNTARTEFGKVTISANTAQTVGGGIAIANPATVLLHDSDLTGNKATGGDGGGVINAGTLGADRSRISRNNAGGAGGGISTLTFPLTHDTARTTLKHSSVQFNVAAIAPGGLHSDLGLVSLLADTEVSDNLPTNCSGSPTPIPNCSN